MTKSLFHCHTTFSDDGKLSCEELHRLGESRGFDYIFLSDHYEHINEQSFKELINECNRINITGKCKLVPGYEKSWNGFHICAYNLERWIDSKDFGQWCLKIKNAGGLIVAAHPSKYNFRIPQELLDGCDGIEIWNSKWPYDGPVYPNPSALDIAGDLLFFCGQDVHKRRDFCELSMHIDTSEKLTVEHVFDALRDRRYSIKNKTTFCPYWSRQNRLLLLSFHLARRTSLGIGYRLLRRVRTYANFFR